MSTPAGTPTVDQGADRSRPLLPVATAAHTRAAVGRLLRPHRGLAAATLAVLVVGSVAGLLVPPLLGRIVDLVSSGAPPAAVTAPALALGAVAVADGVLVAAGLVLVARLGERLLARLREEFVARALTLPLEQIERAGAGDLTARVTGDVSVVAQTIRDGLPELARAGLTIVLTLGAMGLLDWRFLIVALLAVPIQVHTARWYVRNAIPLYARQRVATGAQQQQLIDSVGGAATVRAHRLAREHTEQVSRRSTAAVELVLQGITLVTRFYSRLNLAEFVGLSAVLAAGFVLVADGSVSVGTATAAALYFHNLFGPINIALATVDDALVATASLARLVGVADLPAPAEGREVHPPVTASVRLVGVGHSYAEGRPVLHDVDLAVEPGERVALVGASGAGKTTLARLVAGVQQPSTGTVALGGVTIEELDRATVRRTVALVTQEAHVFAGPLQEDLRLARPTASDDELRTALERVGALSWSQALPKGTATVVGEGAHQLTVTQAQQLALARLVLADPPVAVLDEATAEAGSAGARVLEASAAAALTGRTGLVVAHRLTQAAAADRVLVLEDGRVVEDGTHDALLAAGGRYARLWAAWQDTRAHATTTPDPEDLR